MKILIADDHHLIIEGLKDAILKRWPDYAVSTAVNSKQLFDQLAIQSVDLILLDIKFGKDNAKDFIGTIKSDFPETKIVLLSSIADAVTINYFKKKAHGYVIKTESVNEILNAIEKVDDQTYYLSPEAQKKTASFSLDQSITLTKREREIMKVIMAEKSIKEIAQTLDISEKTVEMHRSNLFLKLDVKNVTGLVKKVIALGLIED